MATINQLTLEWAGGPVQGVSLSTFWSTAPNLASAQTKLKAFASALRPFLPANVSLATANTGKMYEDTTGLALGQWTSGTADQAFGSGGPNCAAPCGALMRMQTTTVIGRRILAGHVFLVPLSIGAYGPDGRIDPNVQAGISAAATTLVTPGPDGPFYIWHRPKKSSPGAQPTGGQVAAVTSASVNSKVAVLTSRRD